MKKFIIAAMLMVFSSSCASAGSSPAMTAKSALEGTWLMQSVHYVSEEKTHSIDPAQPGIFQFTDGWYTIMWTNTREPRTPFSDLANPTPEETNQAFKSIVFNAGQYEIDGDQVRTRAEIARVPGFEGGRQFYHYQIDGDTLELRMVDETYPDGTKPEWLGTWETLFVMRRAD